MSFFKAYDMRGTYGVDFDLDDVRKIGKALPLVIRGKRWLVGRDCRLTGKEIKAALKSSLLSAGVEVDDIGLCTTPMIYYFTAVDSYDASVMVTASHNPPSDNGLKVSRRGSLPVGYDSGLKEVERLSGTFDAATLVDAPDEPQRENYIDRYCEWISSKVDLKLLEELSFAVDCSNGMAGILVKRLFPNAVVINDTLDGSFPSHSPNPLKSEAREQVSRLVRERKLDCAVIFDGDADRAMFVDENGSFVQCDYLIPVIARECRDSSPSGICSNKVLHDVRTSRAVIEALEKSGFEPVMIPVGHAFAKPKMRELSALCGGELAGHYYFGDFFGCDSGVLAAMRVLLQVAKAKRQGCAFSEMMKPIACRYANSGELNFKVDDKSSAIKRVLDKAAQLSEEISRSEMDGVRIDFADGWINVRPSNTEPYLRLIAEFNSREKLSLVVSALTDEISKCS